jgi:hypothetical protein
MFVEFRTVKGEVLSINKNKILLFGVGKKGTVIITEDGNIFEVVDNYETVKNQLVN